MPPPRTIKSRATNLSAYQTKPVIGINTSLQQTIPNRWLPVPKLRPKHNCLLNPPTRMTCSQLSDPNWHPISDRIPGLLCCKNRHLWYCCHQPSGLGKATSYNRSLKAKIRRFLKEIKLLSRNGWYQYFFDAKNRTSWEEVQSDTTRKKNNISILFRCWILISFDSRQAGITRTPALARRRSAFEPVLEGDLGGFYYQRNPRSYVLFPRRCLISLV